MIKVNSITKAVYAALDTDPEFAGWQIERSEYVNEDPNRCPWVGIYRGSMKYAPETLGDGPDRWTGEMVLRLVVQAADFSSGQASEDELEDMVEAVISKVLTDTTLRGTIDMVTGIDVTYSYSSDDEHSVYFQAALIELTLEVSTS